MKIQHLLILPVLLILLSSCKKDDPIIQQEDTASYIKATFDWQQDFLDFTQTTNVSDSLPVSLDILNDDLNSFTLEVFDNEPEFDFVTFVNDPTGDYIFPGNSLVAYQTTSNDTLSLLFLINGDLEAKSYSYITEEQLDAYYNDNVDFPNGTIIPFLSSEKSNAALMVAYASFDDSIDFGSSTFEITALDEATNEISGNFTFDWEIADEDNGNIQLLKVNDGVFNNLKLVK